MSDTSELFKVVPKDVVVEGEPDHVIELAGGEFAGSQFNFGQIEFAGEDANGNGMIKFQYEVHTEQILDEKKEAFETQLGVVLHAIIADMVSVAPAPVEAGQTSTIEEVPSGNEN